MASADTIIYAHIAAEEMRSILRKPMWKEKEASAAITSSSAPPKLVEAPLSKSSFLSGLYEMVGSV
jgi:hypothetical protein